jgi:hypothetical protein
MVEVVHLFWGKELQDGQVLGVGGLAAAYGLARIELAEGLQRGDGGHQERLVARPFLAAGGRPDGLVFRVGLLGGGELWLLGAEPGLHGFAEDGGALGLGQRGALPRGGAGPAVFDLAEVSAHVQSRLAHFLGDLAGLQTHEVQTLDFGQVSFPVDERRLFFFNFFAHGFPRVFRVK